MSVDEDVAGWSSRSALLSTLVAPAAGRQAPQKVVFALNWFAVGDHAAYWVALDRGYYRAKGLDVELQNSKGSGDSIAKVDTGRADLGLADAWWSSRAVGAGREDQGGRRGVRQHPAEHLERARTRGITKPKDLEGKTLGGAARATRSGSSSRPSPSSTASMRAR